MIIIRDEEFSYYLELNKNYRRKPDFGLPYSYLYDWIDNISEQQNLNQVRFVLGRLKGGIEVLPSIDSDWW
ncbi:MAG: hypothetical protein F6K41_42820 [Symploca sp. SIO3E6]|nr:hypothetical protein [Caldora sp. SIO3E6]